MPAEQPSELPRIRLGVGGPLVGAQGLGCMGMSEFYGSGDVAESRRTLERAAELGVTMFDTADAYGTGRNEELLGTFVRENRDRVLIATKFGLIRKADDPRYRGIDTSPDYVRTAVEASLRRLGVETIDLYYAHRLDPGTPVEDTVGAMADLVRQGKVRHLGLSEVDAAQLRRAHAVHPIAAVQSEWSLFSRDLELPARPSGHGAAAGRWTGIGGARGESVVAAAADLGVAIVAYSPLGRGFLTGAFTDAEQLDADDARRHMPRFTGDNAAHNADLLAPVHRIAEAHAATPAQIALAWIHHRTTVHGLPVFPIPGTRSRSRLGQNVQAATIILSRDELAALDPLAASVAGSRNAGLAFASTAKR